MVIDGQRVEVVSIEGLDVLDSSIVMRVVIDGQAYTRWKGRVMDDQGWEVELSAAVLAYLGEVAQIYAQAMGQALREGGVFALIDRARQQALRRVVSRLRE